MVPKTISCNCNLISRPSTCLSLNLHFLNSSVALPKTEEMDLVRGLRSKIQKILLIPYHKAGVLDKGKDKNPANQKPNQTQNTQTKSSGKISTILTTKSLIYNFHVSNEVREWVSCPFQGGTLLSNVNLPSPLSPTNI